jgi:hypothetical protein
MLPINFKREHIDNIIPVFNSLNENISNTVNELTETFDDSSLWQALKDLKQTYNTLQKTLKYLFVEIRLNLLLLNNSKDKDIYKNYCQISLKAIDKLIKPEKIELQLKQSFGTLWTYEESYFSPDMVNDSPDFLNAVNHLYTYSLMMNYYHALLSNIINSLNNVEISDSALTKFDNDKNTINQKLLLIHYLLKDKKLNLNPISQDTTKQARIFSFLFDNSYENIRKSLPHVHEAQPYQLKSEKNLIQVLELIEKLGPEFQKIKCHLEEDLLKSQSKINLG